MNAKYALALILALQVSMSLCEVPQPSPELLAKVNEMEQTFMRRLMNFYNKFRAAIAPVVEHVKQDEQVQEYAGEIEASPAHQTATKIMQDVGVEAGKMTQTLKTSLLGLYEHYFREDYGASLDQGINTIKGFLNMYFPADPPPAAA